MTRLPSGLKKLIDKNVLYGKAKKILNPFVSKMLNERISSTILIPKKFGNNTFNLSIIDNQSLTVIPTNLMDNKNDLMKNHNNNNLTNNNAKEEIKNSLFNEIIVSLDISKIIDMQHILSSRIILTPNGGGGRAILSEYLSFETLRELFNAELLHTEMELLYSDNRSPKIDFSVRIAGITYGVSVTRCFNSKDFSIQTLDKDFIIDLISKKFEKFTSGLIHVQKGHRWHRQILHLFVPNYSIANQIIKLYESNELNHSDKEITVLVISIVNAEELFYHDEKKKKESYVKKTFNKKELVKKDLSFTDSFIKEFKLLNNKMSFVKQSSRNTTDTTTTTNNNNNNTNTTTKL
ncbi:hypothetical protein ABK040_007572 [Willaertia magna]